MLQSIASEESNRVSVKSSTASQSTSFKATRQSETKAKPLKRGDDAMDKYKKKYQNQKKT